MSKFEVLKQQLPGIEPKPYTELGGGVVSPAFLWVLSEYTRADHTLVKVNEFLDDIYSDFEERGDLSFFLEALDAFQTAMTYFHYVYPKSVGELIERFEQTVTSRGEMTPRAFAEITWQRLRATQIVLDKHQIESHLTILGVYAEETGEDRYELPFVLINIKSLKTFVNGERARMAKLLAEIWGSNLDLYQSDDAKEFLAQRKAKISQMIRAGDKWERESV